MKQKFNIITSTCVPLPLENVDTDQIIPARFLKATTREEKFFGDNLFLLLPLFSFGGCVEIKAPVDYVNPYMGNI